MINKIRHIDIALQIHGYSDRRIKLCRDSSAIQITRSVAAGYGAYPSLRCDFSNSMITIIRHIDIVESVNGHIVWIVKLRRGANTIRGTRRAAAGYGAYFICLS